jgi:hypothetical protein
MVSAVVWAMFGLMAASLSVLATALFAAISRIDGLRAEFGGRLDGLHAEFSGRFDGLHEDLRELRSSVTNVDRRLTAAGG